jgi:hypothetical protein
VGATNLGCESLGSHLKTQILDPTPRTLDQKPSILNPVAKNPPHALLYDCRIEWKEHQERIIQGGFRVPQPPSVRTIITGSTVIGSEAGGEWLERRSWDGVYAKDEARKLGAEQMRVSYPYS